MKQWHLVLRRDQAEFSAAQEGKNLGFNSGVGHEGRVPAKVTERSGRKLPTSPHNRGLVRADSGRSK